MHTSAKLRPERVGLPALRRWAADRRHRRDFAAVGSPVFAAFGVLAVALAGVQPAASHDIAPLTTRSVAAPKQFNLLVPFAAFGWLPGHEPKTGPKETGITAATEDSLQREGFALNTYAYGACRKIPKKPELSCPPQPSVHIRLYGRAPAVNGHAAYLVERSPDSIAWQYAPHGWAILWNSMSNSKSLRTIVRIADAVVFDAQQRVEFAVQITQPPAGLAGLVNSLDYALRTGPLFAYRFSVFHHGSRALSLDVSSWGGACGSGKHTTINGYLVHYWHYAPGSTGLCVKARGLVIGMDGRTKPMATYPLHVFKYLKILGSNPKDWVKQPIS